MSNRPLRMGSTLLCALMMLGTAGQVSAQDGEQYRVVVTPLQPAAGADDDFGRDVAGELEDLIDDLPTHVAVGKREIERTIEQRRLRGANYRELDCVKGQQLARYADAELVVCGSYTERGSRRTIEARFESVGKSDAFEVPAFEIEDADDAAGRITTVFRDFVGMLSDIAWCNDYRTSLQFDEAIESCERALEVNPSSLQARYLLARTYFDQDSLETALDLFEDFLSDERAALHEDALMTAGLAAARLGESEAAGEYFAQYLALNPGNVRVRVQVARDVAQAGEPVEAFEMLWAVREDSMSAEDRVVLEEYTGHFALASADVDTTRAGEMLDIAAEMYERVFDARGEETNTRTLRNLIAARSQTGEIESAVALGERAVRADSTSGELWLAYAQALEKAGRVTEAVEALDRMLDVAEDVNSAVTWERKAVWLTRAGERGRLEQALREASSLGVDMGRLSRAVFAEAYNNVYREGRRQAALPYFRLASRFATDPMVRAMAEFWTGYAIYNQALEIEGASTVESARRTLPMFREAKQHFERSEAYAEQEATIDLAKILASTDQAIERQQIIIEHGG